jgi:hypothetical protein
MMPIVISAARTTRIAVPFSVRIWARVEVSRPALL